MKTLEFNDIITEQLEACVNTLSSKSHEYATDDRLHNFKVAANILSCEPHQALGGMMSKHTVSIYDMINSGGTYSEELWNEKITDSINYLLLLKALVYDTQKVE